MNALIRKAEADYRRALASAEEQHADRMLAIFKAALSRHRTHNHDIRICYEGGRPQVLVGNEPAWALAMRTLHQPVGQTLRAITNELDSEWAHHLHNVRLN